LHSLTKIGLVAGGSTSVAQKAPVHRSKRGDVVISDHASYRTVSTLRVPLLLYLNVQMGLLSAAARSWSIFTMGVLLEATYELHSEESVQT
jgi:hypothetical protein